MCLRVFSELKHKTLNFTPESFESLRDYLIRMRRFTLRRYLTIFLPAMFLILVFSLYLMMESVSVYGVGTDASPQRSDSQLEMKLQQIEEDLKSNQKTINRIKQLISDIAKDSGRKDLNKVLGDIVKDHDILKTDNISMSLNWEKKEAVIPSETCKLAQAIPAAVDVQMRDVFAKLPFDNPDGGVWKQGFDIKYDPNQWQNEKLKVFVIPQSHCDPGWIKTFDGYYQDQVRHILNLMVEKLEAYPSMRFIYAEISFFATWWNQIDATKKLRVKKLLEKKQLELVTGGWVMTDEASAHYFSMIDQLIEGNQWMVNQLGVKPVSGWAIDPFGYSATMPYILQQSGFKNMLIQRVHYSLKKYFSQTKQLEFNWRQTWDHSGSTDMFCHAMPFYSYDIPHTCGPNPKVCCQFDFKRLPGGNIRCPWNVPPSYIDASNVKERAETLLDQYRQKAQLYKNNVVLIPLGDDFRYDKGEEWDQQHNNYKLLFDYINSNTALNAEVKFATLTDYFDALHERAGTGTRRTPTGYPVLSGDFFSYSDRDDHYWTGYFTSRPFYKGLDRVLENHQRAGEILYSLALAEARRLDVKTFEKDALLSRIVTSRRQLGLFQHHDAVAGTAKDFVVVDYGVRLLQGLVNMKRVIADSAQFLLSADKTRHHPGVTLFDVDETRASHDSLPEKTVIHLNDYPHAVVFFNSLAHNRSCLVTLFVDDPNLEVHDANGGAIAAQISPQWSSSTDVSTHVYRVNFIVIIPALGLVKYTVVKAANPINVFSKVTIFNLPESSKAKVGPFRVEKLSSKPNSVPTKISIRNREMELNFSPKTGLLQEVFLKDSEHLMKVNISFVRYGTRYGRGQSGSYLFIPDGEARYLQLKEFPLIRVIEGPLVSELIVSLPLVDHLVRIVNSPGVESSAFEILNLVDIRQERNTEVAMRFLTDIKSDDDFFTDSNGFQILRRRTYDKLPLNANFYPMATMAFLEDKKHRFSLLSGQSLGVASLNSGWLEVMQDRRLDQDDERGMGQPVHDNKITPNLFRILVEPSNSELIDQHAGYASLLSNMISQQMLHPVHILPSAPGADVSIMSGLLPVFQPLETAFPCDIHLLNLRTMLKPEDGGIIQPNEETGLILHRLGVDCRFPTKGITCHFTDGKIAVSSMFRNLRVSEANLMSLSLLDRQSPLNYTSVMEIPPMEIRALSVQLR